MLQSPSLSFKKRERAKMQATPMIRQYLEIKNRYGDYLLFYRMGDFYELFFDDAVTAASALDIALTKRGKHEGKDIPMAGVPAHSHEIYLLKLIETGFRVAVCEQIETPEQAKARGAKGPLRRDVVRLVTPGTLTEESLLTPKKANYLLATGVGGKANDLGCAWIDVSTGDFYAENVRFQNLEAFFHKIDPAEILLPDSLWKNLPKPVFAVFKNRIKPLADARFNSRNAEKTLRDAYKIASTEILGFDTPDLVRAAGIVVEYITLTRNNEINFLPAPKIVVSRDFLRVDAQTLRNLEIVKTLKGTYEGSLLSRLDDTRTAGGGRLLCRTLVSPLANIELIRERQRKTLFFVNDRPLAEAVRQILKGTPDLERSLARIALKRALPRDLKAVKLCLKKAKAIREILPGLEFWRLPVLTDLSEKLENALSDESTTDPEGGTIRRGFDKELDEAIEARDRGDKLIKELELKYRNLTGINALKIRSNNLIGHYVEVSDANQSKVPEYFKHKQALSNGKRYVSPELLEIAEKIDRAEVLAIESELRILEELRAEIDAKRTELGEIAAILAEIDVYGSLALRALADNHAIPEIVEETCLEIEAGRHPIVERGLDETFIPNDCRLTANRFALLTGPNMAGKSTYLRQNALIVWMAHCGLAIPAKQARIGLIDQLFCRVGAADDLAAGRSTFMVEMIETASILRQATEKSFIILDEIGRGTSTEDGLAIAGSVSEYIVNVVKARCVFATHYRELAETTKTLPIKRLTVKIIEQGDEVIFLREVIEGVADKSYGIHVAELAGLPEVVIANAKKLLATNGSPNRSAKPLEAIPHAAANASVTLESRMARLVKAIDPDELTPKAALALIYELRAEAEAREPAKASVRAIAKNPNDGAKSKLELAAKQQALF